MPDGYKTVKVCRKCGHELTTKDVLSGYKYYCPSCDEDMFGFEARERVVASDSKLLSQFKKWAKRLLKVNPDYVRDPERLRGYVKGPNWDHPDPEYAHYRDDVAFYGPGLLGMFERLRAGDGEEGLAEYRALLNAAGIEERK